MQASATGSERHAPDCFSSPSARTVGGVVTQAQKGRVVMTGQGKPAAVLGGMTKQDWESVILQTDPQFWKLIHARLKPPPRSLSQVQAHLLSSK